MEGLAKIVRIDSLDTLTSGQQELLRQAQAVRPDLSSQDLVVYRTDDGHDLVAPRSDEVFVGDCPVSAGDWALVRFRVVIGDEDSDDNATLHLVPAMGDAVRWLSS